MSISLKARCPHGSQQLLEACCEASPVDLDGEAYEHLINASFSTVSGQGNFFD